MYYNNFESTTTALFGHKSPKLSILFKTSYIYRLTDTQEHFSATRYPERKLKPRTRDESLLKENNQSSCPGFLQGSIFSGANGDSLLLCSVFGMAAYYSAGKRQGRYR